MRYFLIFLLVSLSLSSIAQSRNIIFGLINDQNGKVVPNIPVILISESDTTFVRYTLSDSVGYYRFNNVPQSKDYYLKVKSRFFSPYVSNSFNSNQEQLAFDIKLTSLTNQIEEVVVTRSKPLIERINGKLIFNVNEAETMVGRSGAEILPQIPGITGGGSGKFSINGRPDAIVLIDGQQTYLKGADLTNFLNSLQSSQIDRVEVISNPSSSFDAEGNGVINIVTNGNKKIGLNFSALASYRQGKYGTSNNSINFGLRNNKINLFGGFGYQISNGFEEYQIKRNLSDKKDLENQVAFDQYSYFKNRSTNINGNLNFQYYVNKKTSIFIRSSIVSNPKKSEGNSSTDLHAISNMENSTTKTNIEGHSKWLNSSSSFGFRHNFTNEKHYLNLDINHLYYTTKDNQSLTSEFIYSNPENTRSDFEAIYFPRTIKIWSSGLKYSLPISDLYQIETGVKFSDISTDNDSQYSNFSNGELNINDSLSNRFIFNEKSLAGFLDFTTRFENLNFALGLRIENTKNEGQVKNTNRVDKQDYTKLFPSASVIYDMDDDNKLTIGYSRRIQRPDYRDFNPFRYYIDRYTFESGNPNLKPQISDNLILEHVFEKGLVTTTLLYSKTNDAIITTVKQNLTTNESYTMPENIGNRFTYSLNVNGIIPISEFFNSNLNMTLAKNKIDGVIDNESFTLDQLTFSSQIMNQMKLPRRWSLELYGMYSSQSLDDVFLRRPYGTISFGISKAFFENRLKLRLSFADMFAMNKYVASSKYQNIDVKINNKFQTRTAMFTITYNFSKGLGVKQTSSEDLDEQRRVNK